MLTLENIYKTFDPNTLNEKKAIQGLSLQVNEGDFITIIGANGAGKSTLFNLICGNFLIDSGKIRLDGKDITFQPEHIRARKIGRLFQDPMAGTAPAMTITENLALAAGSGGWLSRIKKADIERFREKLKELDMDLENRMDSEVGLLSGGQRQALTLMMATINPPKLLLLDEHTAALDPSMAEKVINITTKIVDENNLTCLMITHNMEQAINIGNRLIMMDDGNIILDVSGEEKQKLTVPQLLEAFKDASGKRLDNDRMLLTK